MLARLGHLGSWSRKLFPPSGEQYAVFNLAVGFSASVFLVYVINDPSRSAANWVTTDGVTFGGLTVVLAGIVSSIAAYTRDLTRIALVLIAAATFVWASILTVGVVVEFRPSTLGLAILYWLLARQALQIAKGGL